MINPALWQIEEARTVRALQDEAAAQGADAGEIGDAVTRYFLENSRDQTALAELRQRLRIAAVSY